MRKDEFEEGAEWAYRPTRSLGSPAARVALVAIPARKGPIKVKVRHVDGDLEGMEEFVHSTHLICRWKDWAKVERDERKEASFLDYMESQPEVDRVVIQAASAVLLSSGEDLLLDDFRNYTRVYDSQVAGLERVAARAGVADQPWRQWPCFRNRNGDIYTPVSILVDLALAFAKAEPETVNLYLDVEEKGQLEAGYAYGERYRHEWLIKSKPAWALARSWTFRDGARDHLREEVRRLQHLLHEAVAALRTAGDERTAARLGRALKGR